MLSKHGAAIFQADSTSVSAAFAAIIPALTAATSIHRMFTNDGINTEQHPAIAIHTGPAHPWNNGYTGETFNRAQSILAAVHPGQTILSVMSQAAIVKAMPPDISFQELGSYRLKDLLPAMPLSQIMVAGLQQEFPPLKTLEQVTHNLPILLSPLIGREHEVQAVAALLANQANRQITILGSSGAGKTRLALQVAVEQVELFPDGVYVVSLAPVVDADLVLAEIAHILEIHEQGQEPLFETMVAALADKRILIVLDNFEQLLPAAPLLDKLLRNTAHLTLLVTSQVACDIPQEHLFHLPPLTLPEQAPTLPLDELSRIPAVALFIQRARDINPAFAFNSMTAPAVVKLCERLGGLPLAIELVAAQSKRYFPNDMLLLLKRHLLMAQTAGRSNSRKDILYPVLDWICEVLGTNIAAFFSRLGVFAGGCTAESATICNPKNELGLQVQPTLNLLLNNHLLMREELKADQVRYTMLDAVHEYAQQRLSKRRETARFEQLHAEFYTHLAEEAAPQLLGKTQIGWLNRLGSTHHNLRTALKWTAEYDPMMFMRLAGALRRFWFLHAHFSEGREWLEQALKHRHLASADVQANLLHGFGLIAIGQGNFNDAQANFLEALELRRSIGDKNGIMALLGNLGAANASLGNMAAAIEYTQQGIEVGATIPELSENAIGMMHNMLNNLGVMACYETNFELAKTYLTELYDKEIQRPVNQGFALTLNNLGFVEYLSGNLHQAKDYLIRGLAAARELGNELAIADTLTNYARVLITEGHLDQAHAALDEAFGLREKHGDRRALALTLQPLAQLLVAEGKLARAVTINTLVQRLFEHIGVRLTPLDRQFSDRIEQQTHPFLDDAAIQAAQTIPSIELADVLAYVREETPMADRLADR